MTEYTGPTYYTIGCAQEGFGAMMALLIHHSVIDGLREVGALPACEPTEVQTLTVEKAIEFCCSYADSISAQGYHPENTENKHAAFARALAELAIVGEGIFISPVPPSGSPKATTFWEAVSQL